MGGQAPGQNVAEAPANAAALPHVLLEDPIFKSIHDAFQMGWNIIELKSRIQLGALSSNIAGTPTTVPVSSSADLEQTHELIQKVMPTVAHAQSNLLQPQASMIQSQLNNAPSDNVQHARFSLTELPESTWSTSLWRATFTSIADNHKSCFPDSSSEDTYYDLPKPPDSSTPPPNYEELVKNQQTFSAANIHLPYYYLYPDNQNTVDFATVGIPKDDQFPGTFKLYDVTRRALNCLTLLYTNPDESLIPLTIRYFQQQLLQHISTYRTLAATLISNTDAAVQPQVNAGDSNQPVSTQSAEATVSQPLTTHPVVPAEPSLTQQKIDAIQLVSNLTMQYLENWDSFARETFYVSGSEVTASNELQLVAYEAGRAMSSLSWGITSTTVHLENANDHNEELNTLLKGAWLHIFDDTAIASIQHQISALSSAMDGAYQRVHANVSRSNENNAQATQNLDLPGQSIQAITYSLDYWKRAVKKICGDDNQKQITTSSVTSNGSQATQKSTTTTGPTGTNDATQTPSIPKMSPSISSQLRQTLIKQAQVWQPLLLHQQSLQDFTISYITQRIWSDFMQEFEQATGNSVFNTVERNVRRYLIPVIGGIAALILILGFLVFLLVRFPSLQQSLITTFVLVIGSVVGFFGTMAGRARSFLSTESTSATAAAGNLGAVSAIAGIAETGIIDAFQNAYQQIQAEFDYLDHNVSVTYPLVEFFIANPIQSFSANEEQAKASNSKSQKSGASGVVTGGDNAINDAYDFLTQIVWTDQDRADEIARITRAALGPIGALIGVSNQP